VKVLIKAVATDVDGTITDCEEKIDIESIKAIRKLEEAGIKVSLCSGNALCVLKGLAKYIGCTGPLICENGGVVEQKGKMFVLARNRSAREVVTELKRIHGSSIRESWSNSYRFADMAIFRTIDFANVDAVVKTFPGMKVIDSGFAYHILDENVNKGTGIEKLAELAKVEVSEIAGIGDSDTDIDLLQACGFRCAVSNASPGLKAVAEFIAKDSFGRGFAEITDYILSRNR
jgi:hypothetical protein